MTNKSTKAELLDEIAFLNRKCDSFVAQNDDLIEQIAALESQLRRAIADSDKQIGVYRECSNKLHTVESENREMKATLSHLREALAKQFKMNSAAAVMLKAFSDELKFQNYG